MEEKQPEQKIQVRFPRNLWQTLKRFAEDDHRSFNGEVIWILEEYVAERNKQKEDGTSNHKDA